jgi:hypothetical protein
VASDTPDQPAPDGVERFHAEVVRPALEEACARGITLPQLLAVVIEESERMSREREDGH